MTIHPKIRRPIHVTPRSDHPDDDHAHDSAGAAGSSAASSPRPKARRSLVVGAAVLIGVAVVAGSAGAGATGLLTGKDVRDDSLRSADFRNGSISGAKVRDGSLSQRDVGFDLTGDPGIPGNDGPRGFPGIRGIHLRTGSPQAEGIAGTYLLIANCAAGETAIAGGAQLDVADPGVLPYIVSSGGIGLVTWNTVFYTPGGGGVQYTPWVVCAVTS
jgi:hypothetical protein